MFLYIKEKIHIRKLVKIRKKYISVFECVK